MRRSHQTLILRSLLSIPRAVRTLLCVHLPQMGASFGHTQRAKEGSISASADTMFGARTCQLRTVESCTTTTTHLLSLTHKPEESSGCMRAKLKGRSQWDRMAACMAYRIDLWSP